MATSDTILWSQVVAKAAGMKIITVSRRKNPDESISTMVLYRGRHLRVSSRSCQISSREILCRPLVLYKHPDYQDQQLARKAAAIVRQALTPEAILFSFPPNAFTHRTEAYKAVEDQIGPVDDVRACNQIISNADSNFQLQAGRFLI